jgi:hypothetical protein
MRVRKMEERNKKIIFALIVVAAVLVMASRIDSGVPDTSSRTTGSSGQDTIQLDTELLIDETEQQTESETETDTETEAETETESERTEETATETESEAGIVAQTTAKSTTIRSTGSAIQRERVADESESETEQLQNLTVEEELAKEKTYDGTQTAYAADNINIRQRPGRDDDISVLDSYYKGETVILFGETPNWYVVEVEGTDQKGYVSKEYISDEKEMN